MYKFDLLTGELGAANDITGRHTEANVKILPTFLPEFEKYLFRKVLSIAINALIQLWSTFQTQHLKTEISQNVGKI